MITMFENSFMRQGAVLRKTPKVNVLFHYKKEYLPTRCNPVSGIGVLPGKSFMKKSILIAALICLVFLAAQGQSIDNRNWKAHLPAPINDTVTLHLNSDSSFITNSGGQVVIRMSCAVSGNTLTIVNRDADEHGCPDQRGTYTVNFSANSFTLSVVSDPCEGRAHALTGVRWTESAKNEQGRSY